MLTPKGADEGGGGGATGRGTLRKDFRVLAFWLGSVVTDANGQRDDRRHAAGVADDVPHHGGGRRQGLALRLGESEIRINKPVMLSPAFPRFLAVGDKAFFGAVVTSQLKERARPR